VKLQIHNETAVAQDYRSNRVRSLFNVDDDRGAIFELDVDIDAELGADNWNIGLIVGPSGSGKSSIGRELVEQGARWWNPRWDTAEPIANVIGRKHSFDTVTGALASVGLGDVPAWLRPYQVLSMGEQFRVNLARLCVEGADRDVTWVIDEFTSVVDRQIAKIGSMAFAKTWRRGGGQAVLLSCHHDIIEWLVPDWCYDTATGETTHPKATGSRGPASTSESKRPAGNTGKYSSHITI
jgi:hypothetical protein